MKQPAYLALWTILQQIQALKAMDLEPSFLRLSNGLDKEFLQTYKSHYGKDPEKVFGIPVGIDPTLRPNQWIIEIHSKDN